MWHRRVLTILTGTLILLTLAVVPARAGGEGEPFLGDLDGDGLTDRASLYTVGGETCGVRFERGRPGGGYHPATSHPYELTERAGQFLYCPDMGVILDIGGDGTAEIVVSFYSGSAGDDILVLRDFVVVDSYLSPFSQPGYLDVREFNGDGLPDLYLSADFGFISLLNTPDGRLVRGPVEIDTCGYYDQDVELADFAGNGGLGVLVWWGDNPCLGSTSGVAVTGSDGTYARLERGLTNEDRWTARAVDADADGRTDVRTEHETTGEVTHFISLGDGTFGESPKAVFDRPTVHPKRPTVIRVLANDLATTEATVTITSQPKFGRVRVNGDRTITYTPLRPHDGGDRFTYRLDQDGKHNVTAVSMRFTA